ADHFHRLRSDALVTTVEATSRPAGTAGAAEQPRCLHAWHREGEPAHRCRRDSVTATPSCRAGIGADAPDHHHGLFRSADRTDHPGESEYRWTVPASGRDSSLYLWRAGRGTPVDRVHALRVAGP